MSHQNETEKDVPLMSQASPSSTQPAPTERYSDVAYCIRCDSIFPLNMGDTCMGCQFEEQGRCRSCGSDKITAAATTCDPCQQFKARRDSVGFMAALEELNLDFNIGLGPRTRA